MGVMTIPPVDDSLRVVIDGLPDFPMGSMEVNLADAWTRPRPLVYLSGTITKDPKHLEWRKWAEAVLSEHDIGVLSPVRGKNPEDWTKDGLNGSACTAYSGGAFVFRDRRDLERCNAVLLYFPESPGRQSIGTWAEFGYAVWGLGKPVVVVSELPEVIGHPFVYRLAAKVVPTLEEAIDYLVFLLG